MHTRCHRRRATAYLVVLGTTVLVTIIGVSALLAVRIEGRGVRLTTDFAQARLLARSAISMGQFWIAQDDNWRSTYGTGIWADHVALAGGQFSLEVTDPYDGDVTDSETEPIVMTAAGYYNNTRYLLQVTLRAVIEPLDCLNTCLHTSGNAEVKGGKYLLVSGAPLSVNGNLHNDGTIDGDVEAGSVSKYDVITGTVTVPATPRDDPDPALINDYIALATAMPFAGDIDKQVITAGLNQYAGVTNADGLYYLDTANNDITIKQSRIEATLIINVAAKKVTIQDEVFWRPDRQDYPALIVIGNALIKHKSGTDSLSEATRNTNFNPLGAPYQDVSDSDLLDVYSNEIQGLIHITGALTLQETAVFRGTLLCPSATMDGSGNTIIHDADRYTDPPMGYTKVTAMVPVPGSWKQVTN